MAVYKITDIIACEFLKIPKAMFANETYRRLSSDAKLAYALLYDRLSLSKLNGWINERDEVYLIYTREELAEDLGITYKKAIAAFRELTEVNLIAEQRCGRGMPNRIYIVKPELDAAEAKKYVKRENLRTADSAHQVRTAEIADMPDSPPKNCENGTSRTADTEAQDVPELQANHTDNIKTDSIHTDVSQSVPFPRYLPGEADRRTDEICSFDDILDNCQLDTFADEERRILYDALERMYYSDNFKIGNAVLPRAKVRSRMYEIDVNTLQSALDKLHRNTAQIRNVTAYVMSTIFNCITEEYSAAHVDPFLNEMRRRE